jgi:hypothetical protein
MDGGDHLAAKEHEGQVIARRGGDADGEALAGASGAKRRQGPGWSGGIESEDECGHRRLDPAPRLGVVPVGIGVGHLGASGCCGPADPLAGALSTPPRAR